MAEAPKVRNHRVQGINELDEDMQYMLPATNDKDIDLSMLTVVLASSEQVGVCWRCQRVGCVPRHNGTYIEYR